MGMKVDLNINPSGLEDSERDMDADLHEEGGTGMANVQVA